MDPSIPSINSAAARRLQRSTMHMLLLATGFCGVLFISVFVILGALAPSYDSMRDTISALEFTTVSAVQRVNFFIFGILLCCLPLAFVAN